MAASPAPARRTHLAQGLLFGLVFGFLLQKGGVGKYPILIGQLLLDDWTVVKVMATAILVGMIGIFLLHRRGLVELHVKPTRLGGNIVGGLLFGAGFGLSAYCPGTNLTALGQGNWDALAVGAGLLAGSYLYAECSARLQQSVERWGDLGKKTLPDLLPLPRTLTVTLIALLLATLLTVLKTTTG